MPESLPGAATLIEPARQCVYHKEYHIIVGAKTLFTSKPVSRECSLSTSWNAHTCKSVQHLFQQDTRIYDKPKSIQYPLVSCFL